MAVSRTADGKLAKGSVLNPKGRPVGIVDRRIDGSYQILQAAFNGLGGLEALVKWGKRHKDIFYTELWAKILPRDVKISGEIRQEFVERKELILALLTDPNARELTDRLALALAGKSRMESSHDGKRVDGGKVDQLPASEPSGEQAP